MGEEPCLKRSSWNLSKEKLLPCLRGQLLAALGVAGVHYELARAYLAMGQWQDAYTHAAKAVAMQPEIAAWHILMGNIDLKKGDGSAAINEFQAYLRLDSDGPAAASIREMIPKIKTAMAQK
jgi:tetratricopeptide (TPR) repeat protein